MTNKKQKLQALAFIPWLNRKKLLHLHGRVKISSGRVQPKKELLDPPNLLLSLQWAEQTMKNITSPFSGSGLGLVRFLNPAKNAHR